MDFRGILGSPFCIPAEMASQAGKFQGYKSISIGFFLAFLLNCFKCFGAGDCGYFENMGPHIAGIFIYLNCRFTHLWHMAGKTLNAILGIDIPGIGCSCVPMTFRTVVFNKDSPFVRISSFHTAQFIMRPRQ